MVGGVGVEDREDEVQDEDIRVIGEVSDFLCSITTYTRLHILPHSGRDVVASAGVGQAEGDMANRQTLELAGGASRSGLSWGVLSQDQGNTGVVLNGTARQRL